MHKNDIMVQLATSTFDAHVEEILASLICGATVIMLHPDGNMDFTYFDHIIQNKQVTHLIVVPTFLNDVCGMMEKRMARSWRTMRNLCCVGECNQIKEKAIK